MCFLRVFQKSASEIVVGAEILQSSRPRIPDWQTASCSHINKWLPCLQRERLPKAFFKLKHERTLITKYIFDTEMFKFVRANCLVRELCLKMKQNSSNRKEQTHTRVTFWFLSSVRIIWKVWNERGIIAKCDAFPEFFPLSSLSLSPWLVTLIDRV